MLQALRESQWLDWIVVAVIVLGLFIGAYFCSLIGKAVDWIFKRFGV